jgi:hypothetical protein
MADAAPTKHPDDGRHAAALAALDSAMSDAEPEPDSLDSTVQSAVDTANAAPVVIVRWLGRQAPITTDTARQLGAALWTAAARAESEAAFVRLLRQRGEVSDDAMRRQLLDLYACYRTPVEVRGGG